MSNPLFGWDKPEIGPPIAFTDPSLQKYMQGEHACEITPATVDEVFESVAKLRGGGRDDRVKAATTYLRFAQEGVLPASLSRAESYHRAANELRAADVLERSAQCYHRAAIAAYLELPGRYPADSADRETVKQALQLSMRSAGRAKAQYAALGVDDLADDAHRLQQEVLRKRCALDGSALRHILWIWRVTTGYGTSVRRWVGWLVCSLMTFGALYAALHAVGGLTLANGAIYTPATTPVYLAFLNLVAFGAYTQIVPLSPITEAVLVLQALTSFVMIGTGVTFLSRK